MSDWTDDEEALPANLILRDLADDKRLSEVAKERGLDLATCRSVLEKLALLLETEITVAEIMTAIGEDMNDEVLPCRHCAAGTHLVDGVWEHATTGNVASLEPYPHIADPKET